MFEFTGHTGPVNIVEFHPNEYLLASGSSDRYVEGGERRELPVSVPFPSPLHFRNMDSRNVTQPEPGIG